MSTDAYHEALSQVLALTPEEQLELVEHMLSIVRHLVKARSKHNIMEFDGFAKEIWEGVDVEKYINEERNSWDG